MPEPVVFISEFEVRPGAEGTLRQAAGGVVESIRASKPGTALYAAYLDERAASVRFVHAFPDPEALSRHFDGADDRANSVGEILVPVAFEVYGQAAPAALDRLRRDTDASGAELRLFPTAIAGFLRA